MFQTDKGKKFKYSSAAFVKRREGKTVLHFLIANG